MKYEYNPGSHEARTRGCCCPVIDNHYGAGSRGADISHYPEGKILYWIDGRCPLHGGIDAQEG